eukprot:602877-Karenia_brevis.AAC.1
MTTTKCSVPSFTTGRSALLTASLPSTKLATSLPTWILTLGVFQRVGMTADALITAPKPLA